MDMYRTFWNYLKQHMNVSHRPTIFLFLLTAGWTEAGLLLGLAVCLGLPLESAQKLAVALCAGGYAGLIPGFLGGILFLYRTKSLI